LVLAVGCNKSDESALTIDEAGPADEVAAIDSDVDDSDEDVFEIQVAEPEPPAGFEFEAPVRIKAGDEFVSVESPGYACPTLADVDGDNKLDLVVGQFNKGHMQFCKNVAGEGETFKFDSPKWLMTGDEKAVVPGVW